MIISYSVFSWHNFITNVKETVKKLFHWSQSWLYKQLVQQKEIKNYAKIKCKKGMCIDWNKIVER